MALSALLGKPVEIFNVRGKRSKPGLKSQHLNGLILVKDISKGTLEGAEMDSVQVSFDPGDCSLRGGDFSGDTKTAGATTLLAQISLPCLIFSGTPSKLDLRGGTNAKMAPQVEFTRQVLLPSVRKFGADFELEVLRKGYFPRGGGQIIIKVKPVMELDPVSMVDPGEVTRVRITASVAGTLPASIAFEMGQAAEKLLKRKLPTSTDIKFEAFKEDSACGNGSSIFILAETSTGCLLSGDAIGSAKDKPRKTGEAAAEALISAVESGGCVDEYLQDQLVLFMALAGGRSRIRCSKRGGTGQEDQLTLHTRTAIHICETLSGAKFSFEDGILQCDGIGLKNGSICRN